MSGSDEGSTKDAARRLIGAWKGSSYAFGLGSLRRSGELAGQVRSSGASGSEQKQGVR